MDRAARLGRHRRGESLENSRRARGSRRGEAGAAVIIDSDEDCGGGGAAPAVVLAGAVSMQTRSWRMAMQAPVAPVVVGEPPGRKRRTGASAEAGSKGAGTSRSASREKRRVRSRSASGSSVGSRARKRKGAEAEAEAEAGASACVEWAEVSQGDGEVRVVGELPMALMMETRTITALLVRIKWKSIARMGRPAL
ncbi:hypothetical protein GUJ93_ZPchr0005g14415 [Zizania palustris]|uniref:Uncharacterized protein n=1 Tax=Zizania palustris TaxID=103762 RepID=A0A8J5VG47_ZIZPA|nr:hypothetical protein GUJ93_ZPchr0005g14415 [Zizania palustris]